MILTTSLPVFAKSNSEDKFYGGTIQDQIDLLITDYQKALDNAINNGELIVVNDPIEGKIELLTGASLANIEDLWKSTLDTINELQSRPVNYREKAIQLVHSLDNDTVTYVDQIITPYDNLARIERYETGKYQYSIDINTDQIIEIFLVDDRKYSTEALFSEDQLMKLAVDYTKKYIGDYNLDQLPIQISDKEKTIFFFRWEDKSKNLTSGITPFIQISLSKGGDVVNYVNTIPLSSYSLPMPSSHKLATTLELFNEIYANGGNYWTGVLGFPVSTQSNAGYCYLYDTCSPQNFYYANTCFGCSSKIGRWSPRSSLAYVVEAAFIPGTHATTLIACYDSYYNGGSTAHEKCINQSIYSDVWVYTTQNALYDIRRVDLSNQSDGSATREIAWDEIWVKTP